MLSTAKALNVLSQWVLHNVEKREHYFDRLIKCFPANSLEPAEVFKHLDTCILYSKSELSLYRFLDYLVQNNWMLSNFKSRYDGLHIKYGQVSIWRLKVFVARNNSVAADLVQQTRGRRLEIGQDYRFREERLELVAEQF